MRYYNSIKRKALAESLIKWTFKKNIRIEKFFLTSIKIYAIL